MNRKSIRCLLAALMALFCCAPLARAGGIALDPGHSPGKPGALSCSGVHEYVYNDALALEVANRLAASGIPVEISRKPGENLSLGARAAKSAGKDLFISIHHDSVQPQFIRTVNKLPFSEKARGYSIFVSRKNPFYLDSLRAAKSLAKKLRASGLAPTLHHAEPIQGENRLLLDRDLGVYAFDNLAVLKNAQSPAILLEAGVLVNPADEELVRKPAFRAAVAEAIKSTVMDMARYRQNSSSERTGQ